MKMIIVLHVQVQVGLPGLRLGIKYENQTRIAQEKKVSLFYIQPRHD